MIGTLAAYALARFRMQFGVRKMALYLVLLVRMLPGILMVVPLYIALAQWGLLNTRLGLILIYSGLNTSFVVWMMQSFLEEIPRDIEEAAMVDGDSAPDGAVARGGAAGRARPDRHRHLHRDRHL